ncbi:MAG: hypothetical protein AAFR14_09370 [Bacteroidota bacterium]
MKQSTHRTTGARKMAVNVLFAAVLMCLGLVAQSLTTTTPIYGQEVLQVPAQEMTIVTKVVQLLVDLLTYSIPV